MPELPERRFGAGYNVSAYQQSLIQNANQPQQQTTTQTTKPFVELNSRELNKLTSKQREEYFREKQKYREPKVYGRKSLGFISSKQYGDARAKQVNGIFVQNPYQPENIKELRLSQAKSDIAEFQKNNPTEKLIFNKEGKVTAVISGKLQQSVSLKNYEQVQKYNKAIETGKPLAVTPRQSQSLVSQQRDTNRVNSLGISTPTPQATQSQGIVSKGLERVGKFTSERVSQVGAKVFLGYDPYQKKLGQIDKLQDEQNKNVEAFNRLSDQGSQDQYEFLQRNQQIIDEKRQQVEYDKFASSIGFFERTQEKVSGKIKQGIKSKLGVALPLIYGIDTKISESTRGTVLGNIYDIDKSIVRTVVNKPVEIGLVFGGGEVVGGATKAVGVSSRALRIISTGEDIAPEISKTRRLLTDVGKISVGVATTAPFVSTIITSPPELRNDIIGEGIAFGTAFGAGASLGGEVGRVVEVKLFERGKLYKFNPEPEVVQSELLQQFSPSKDLTIGKFSVTTIQKPKSFISISNFDKFIMQIEKSNNKGLKGYQKLGSLLPEIEGFTEKKMTPKIIEGTARVSKAQTELFGVKKGKVFSLKLAVEEGQPAPVRFSQFVQGKRLKQYLGSIEGGIETRETIEGIIGKKGNESLKKALAESKTQGRPVNEEYLKTIKGEEFFGTMKQTRVGQIIGRKRDVLSMRKLNKQYETFALRSRLKELKPEDGILKFKGETAFYDTTLPKALRERKATNILKDIGLDVNQFIENNKINKPKVNIGNKIEMGSNAGFYNTQTKEITLREDLIGRKGQQVLRHELGHHFDLEAGNITFKIAEELNNKFESGVIKEVNTLNELESYLKKRKLNVEYYKKKGGQETLLKEYFAEKFSETGKVAKSLLKKAEEPFYDIGRPRKIPIVKSLTKIKEKSLFEEYNDQGAGSDLGLKAKQLSKSKQINRQASQALADIVLKDITKPTKLTAKQNLQIKQATTFKSTPTPSFSRGAFTGLGLYERTDETTIFQSSNLKPQSSISLPRERVFSLPQERVRNIPREVTREVTREIPREVTREVVREVPREVTREVTRQSLRIIPRLVTREVPRQSLRINLSTPKPPSKLTPKKPITFFLPKSRRKRYSDFGNFIVEERRFGKFKQVGKASSAQQAFDIGSEIVKRDLGATFRIKGLTGNEKFYADLNIFRSAKPKGKELPFTFIQRRKYRLSSFGERAEISLARELRRR